MNDDMLAKIKALPPLDDTIIKIQRTCTNKDSSLNDLVKIVEGDPMLTANILKSSNSPLYGFSREIKNISHAISLFGMATIRGFALSSAIKQNIKIDLKPYGISSAQFLRISVAQSALTFNWFGKENRDMLDILVPASFMVEVGKIIIAREIIEKDKSEEFAEKLKEISTPDELSNLETELVGFSNEEITAKIFEHWNLEAELVDTIRYSNKPYEADAHMQPFANALSIIKNTVNIFGQFEEKSIESSLELVQKHDFNQELFLDAIKKVNQ